MPACKHLAQNLRTFALVLWCDVLWCVLCDVTGGATKSDLWLQIHADVSNLPLILTE